MSRQALLETYDALGPIERDIIERIAARLFMGAAQYGVMQEQDSRDWREEAKQEVLDALVYTARALHQDVRDTEPAPKE